MKDFNKLTDDEIFALDNDQLQKYYELEMAKEGIPFMDYPKEPEYEQKEPADLVLYTSNILNSLYFTDESVVRSIIEVASNNRDKARQANYDYNVNKEDWYEIKKIKKDSWSNDEMTFDVLNKTVYSESKYISVRDINERNKKRLEEYDKLCEQYNAFEDKRNICRSTIFDKYYSVVDKFNNIKIHQDRFAKYVELADGNKDTALKFYKQTYEIGNDLAQLLTQNS